MSIEVEDLFRAATYAPVALEGARSASQDVSAVATDIKRMLDITAAAVSSQSGAPKPQATSSDDGPSAMDVMGRTAAMITGVGPIVTGLLKLFGSDDPEPLPVLEKFQAPQSVSVEAGLRSDGSYAPIRYAQGGLPEATASGPQGSPTIQVNIQAMDSRSFMDRQDDIARAVREAMLHSNALNDVVLEL